jgi:hypothetical protein
VKRAWPDGTSFCIDEKAAGILVIPVVSDLKTVTLHNAILRMLFPRAHHASTGLGVYIWVLHLAHA